MRRRGLTIPEGQSVPWSDTMCKRALDSGRHASNQADVDFGDSPIVKAMGIRTYLTAPVLVGDDHQVYGTLCAVSTASHALDPHAQRVLALFAKLIASTSNASADAAVDRGERAAGPGRADPTR